MSKLHPFWKLVAPTLQTEYLDVDGFVNEAQADWILVGSSPYLDVDDGDANMVKWDYGVHPDMLQYFSFKDTALSTFVSVTLKMMVRTYLGGPFNYRTWIYDGSSWNLISLRSIAGATYYLVSDDVSSVLDSAAKINSARLRLESWFYSGGRFTHGYLLVTGYL